MPSPTSSSTDTATFTISPSSASRIRKSSPQSNPHRTTSIRSLTGLKIRDRFSCYASGLSSVEATKSRLSSTFGQFGELSSVRIIQNRKPHEVYVRFTTEEAARRAIAWCNEQKAEDTGAPITAKHGYNKYCIKFINNKPCRKANCPNQHQWCSPEDIVASPAKLVKAEARRRAPPHMPAVRKQTPPAQSPSLKQRQDHQRQQHLEASLSSDSWMAMASLQTRFSQLQVQFSQQSSTMQILLQQVHQLQIENETLRVHNLNLAAETQTRCGQLASDLGNEGNEANEANDEDFGSMAALVDSVIVKDHEVAQQSRYSHGHAHGRPQFIYPTSTSVNYHNATCANQWPHAPQAQLAQRRK